MILVFDINEFSLCLIKFDLINAKVNMIMKAGQTHYFFNFPLSLPLPPFFVIWVVHSEYVLIQIQLKGVFITTLLYINTKI